MTLPLDAAGPHPENQRKRSELRGARHALIGVMLLAAVLAVVLLGRIDSRVLFFVAATQAAAAVLVATHQRGARALALAAALVALGWGIQRVLVLDSVSWFELSLIGTGVFEALLVAGCTPRDTGPRHRQRG